MDHGFVSRLSNLGNVAAVSHGKGGGPALDHLSGVSTKALYHKPWCY
jgi:hypothetical protein